MRRGLFCFIALLVPRAGFAHGVSPAISGFYAGGALVLFGPEDLLQWVALAAVAAGQPPRHAGWAGEALAAGLLAGFAVGGLGVVAWIPVWAGTAGLLVAGTLLVARAVMPFPALVGLAGCIGVLHGAHLGIDVAARPDKLAVAAGMGITAYLLMAVCIATMIWFQRQIFAVPAVAFRAFGSWVVAIALLLGASEIVGR